MTSALGVFACILQPRRFIEVLTEEVNKWEKAASDVDTMLPHLPETDRRHWKELAKEYRTRAERYKSMIERAKEDDRG